MCTRTRTYMCHVVKMSGGSEEIGFISEEKDRKRTGSLSLSRENSTKSNGGERPSSRASSSTSGRLTREEVSSLYSYTGREEEEEREEALEDFCHNIFDICDTDNDGFITINVNKIDYTIIIIIIMIVHIFRSYCLIVMIRF